jgi:uncharacterized membrane protein YgcG
MRKLGIIAAVVFSSPAPAQTAEPPIEQISIGASLVMLGFLLLAAFIVLSFFCKLLVVFDLLPKKGKLRDAVYWIAKAVSGARLTPGRDSGPRGGSKGSGGNFGGGGSSGNW